MPTSLRTFRIFVSSTFSDLKAERAPKPAADAFHRLLWLPLITWR